MRAFAKAPAGSATIGNGWLRSLGLSAAAALVVLCAALAPAAKGAEPIESFAYLATFGKEGSSSFGNEDSGVAVDQSNGYVFLAEQGNGTVSVYRPPSPPGPRCR